MNVYMYNYRMDRALVGPAAAAAAQNAEAPLAKELTGRPDITGENQLLVEVSLMITL